MTLNIILATSTAVHVGADFRLVDANTGNIVTELSPKVLVLRENGWEAVLTYCGVGRWQDQDTSVWLRQWLQHEPGTSPVFDETTMVLQREGDKWLQDIRRKGRYTGPHTFVLAGLVGGRSKLAVISN